MSDNLPPVPFDRILAIDLRKASAEQMAALSNEAIRRQVPLAQLLGDLILETSRNILGLGNNPKQTA